MKKPWLAPLLSVLLLRAVRRRVVPRDQRPRRRPQSAGPAVDPEYAALLGAQAATGGQSAMPGPGEVAAKIWEHVLDPFYDRGTNDKGLGIQIGYSIARVLGGYLLAALVAIPLGFLIGMSPLYTRRSTPSSRS
jgi:nitrate/nitrite transport system permease protein